MLPSLPLANVLVDTFFHGGVIMWPLLGLSFISLAVIVERVVWFTAASRARDQAQLNRVYAALTASDEGSALELAQASSDPRLRVIAYGLEHAEIDIAIASEVRAEDELRIARRFASVLDTVITLAPLLGLLGTVTGIMHSFKFVGGDQELAASKVSGGIGEALIATAFGLGIAITTLIPFNFVNSKVDALRAELDTVGKNLRLLVEKARSRRSAAQHAPFSETVIR